MLRWRTSPLKVYEKKRLDDYEGVVIRLLDEGVDERVEVEVVVLQLEDRCLVVEQFGHQIERCLFILIKIHHSSAGSLRTYIISYLLYTSIGCEGIEEIFSHLVKHLLEEDRFGDCEYLLLKFDLRLKIRIVDEKFDPLVAFLDILCRLELRVDPGTLTFDLVWVATLL